MDLTVHQIEQPQGTLKELYKASGKTHPAPFPLSHLPALPWLAPAPRLAAAIDRPLLLKAVP